MKKILPLCAISWLLLLLCGCDQNIEKDLRMPGDKYLLLELIEKKVVQGSIPQVQPCPSYFKIESGGRLVYQQKPLEFSTLQKVILARASSVQGSDEGHNICNVLKDVRKLPFYESEFTIKNVLPNGTVLVEYDGKVIILFPKKTWTKLQRTEGYGNLYVTIINHGMCDKSKVEKIPDEYPSPQNNP